VSKFDHRLKRLEKKTGVKRRRLGFIVVGADVDLSSEKLKESLKKYKETYDDICIVKTAIPRLKKKPSKKSQVVAGDSLLFSQEKMDPKDLTDEELAAEISGIQKELAK